MSVLTVIKKIGERVLSVVEYPFKHAIAIEELISDGLKDEPATKDAIVGLVEQFEAVGSDVVGDVATNGLNLTSDLKTIADVRALFAFYQNTFLPAIEAAYADLKKDIPVAPAPAADVAQPGPGLHTVSPA